MSTYMVKRNGKVYVYNYERSSYGNNTKEYNKKYWQEHKEELVKRAKRKRIERKISIMQGLTDAKNSTV